MIEFKGNLNDYVCTAPFDSLYITPVGIYTCCWSDVLLTRSLDINDALNSDTLKRFRKSVLDGSFSMCSDRCWYLHNKYEKVVKKDELFLIADESIRSAIESQDINAKLLS